MHSSSRTSLNIGGLIGIVANYKTFIGQTYNADGKYEVCNTLNGRNLRIQKKMYVYAIYIVFSKLESIIICI